MLKDQRALIAYSAICVAFIISLMIFTQIQYYTDPIVRDKISKEEQTGPESPVDGPPSEFYDDIQGPVPENETKSA